MKSKFEIRITISEYPNLNFSILFIGLHLISCLGVSYKVIMKILANRLLTTLPNLLAEYQFAFLNGRHITDSINLAQEFTHIFNNIRMSRRTFVMTDFSKAFDSLWWDATDVVLESFGFDEILRQLLMTCIKSASFSTMVEGYQTIVIKPWGGVRQGDLLSPLLLIAVIEYLVCLTKKAISDK